MIEGAAGFLWFMAGLVATVVAPFITPALALQAIRLRSRRPAVAAGIAAGTWLVWAAWSVAVAVPDSKERALALAVVGATIVWSGCGLVVALLAARSHRNRAARPVERS